MAIWVTWPAWTKFGTLGIAAGLLTLAAERSELLKNNMFDLEDYPKLNRAIVCDERSKTARTEDGTCNILENPAEGSVYVPDPNFFNGDVTITGLAAWQD